MDDARLTVRSVGPMVSYQDAGRFGMARFGVPASGPMDRLAHAIGLAAVGRPPGDTAIEISMGGIELVCQSGPVTFCVAGGHFRVDHAGDETASWCVRTIHAGETLAIRPGRWGSWAYLAFAGELVCRRWAGSTATHVASDLGGGALTRKSAIVVRHPKEDRAREGRLPVPVAARPRAVARVVLGPQTGCFLPQSLVSLAREAFVLTTAYDRMGVRLDGPGLALGDALSIASEPVIRGSLQVAGDGVVTLLMADHQTTGGYPKIATVISCDLDGIAQLRPGDLLRFQLVGAEEAVALARKSAKAYERLRTALGMTTSVVLESSAHRLATVARQMKNA